MDAASAGEVAELLQQLIRNRCVNDGSRESGNEARNADTIRDYLDGSGVAVERYEPVPERASLVARIEGTDPDAPSLALVGHTDVVPANEQRWSRDAFGGELVDGEVWGRGAIDMLSSTAAMAVAIRRLAAEGSRRRGTLVYEAVADEEALGTHGTEWLLANEPDAVRADYVLTEIGGCELPLRSRSGPKLPVMVGEKGSYWCTIRVRGTGGHASMPLRTENAVATAAEVVTRLSRLRPAISIDESWQRFVEAAELDGDAADALLDPERLERRLEAEPDVSLARQLHACTHTTFAPTVVRGGVKTNVIPDSADVQVDVRTVPAHSGEDVRRMIADALGDELFGSVEVVADSDEEATISPVDTPLWESVQRATSSLRPGAAVVPMLASWATDARFHRRAGAVAYGAGLFGPRMSFGDLLSMFHGDDERIDLESLALGAQFWHRVATDLLA